MKKLISILAILLIIIGFCVFEEVYINSFNSGFIIKSDTVYSSIYNKEENINTDEINLFYDNLESYWNNSKPILCYFANYEKIKGVDESFIKLKTAIKNNDKILAMENIAIIKNINKFFEYMVGFNINNLF